MKVTKSKLKQIILEELSSLETGEQRRDFQKMTDAPAQQQMSFEEWVSAVSALGHEFGEASPNPYDAWMSGRSPEEYAGGLSEGFFGGDFGNKNKTPKPGKRPKRTDAEKERLNRFLKKAGGKEIDERKLSKGEENEKEKIVKGMKKSKKDFKQRYGDDAESVMYATATKIAKDKK